MTEILECVVLAAGVSYLGYRMYSSYALPILDSLRGKNNLRRSDLRQPKLTVERQRKLQDVI